MNKLEATEQLRYHFGDKVADSFFRQAKELDEPNLSQYLLGAFDWETSLEGRNRWNTLFRAVISFEEKQKVFEERFLEGFKSRTWFDAKGEKVEICTADPVDSMKVRFDLFNFAQFMAFLSEGVHKMMRNGDYIILERYEV